VVVAALVVATVELDDYDGHAQTPQALFILE